VGGIDDPQTVPLRLLVDCNLAHSMADAHLAGRRLSQGGRVRLYSSQGNDLTKRFPLILEAMAQLPSCTIDGEAVACDDSGVPSFDLLRHRQRDVHVFLYAFDLIELVGADLRREPLKQRKGPSPPAAC
jgi:hypothetical protein